MTDDQLATARAWKAESSKLPSDNTALVTTVNNQTKVSSKVSLVVHLTHESGDWRVTSVEGGLQPAP
ncbi:hypothetical protein [Streptomyces sp. NPDC048669]|uniref:hypothetical protein n=1 Tax=Streptomyces sp. NPDC048669 TaxID=3155267 RepID=UPI0034439C6E